MDMLKDLINDLVNAGYTDESIMEALDKTRAEKKKETQRRIEEARANLTAAYANYIEAVMPGCEMSPNQMSMLINSLERIEKLCREGGGAVKVKVSSDADKTLQDYLKRLGV